MEAGKYKARANNWGLCKASTGTPQIGISFDLLDLTGQTISYYGSLSDNALEFTVKALRACGWQGDDVSNLQGLDANEVSLTVESEVYNGKSTLKVKWVNPPSGGLKMDSPIEGNDLAIFARTMKAKIAMISGTKPAPQPVRTQVVNRATQSFQPSKPSPTQRNQRPEPPPLDDNDIPF